METTQWFSYAKKPTRVGVYQRLRRLYGNQTMNMYAYWSGRYWYTNASTPEIARRYYEMRLYEHRSEVQQCWRGLVETPK